MIKKIANFIQEVRVNIQKNSQKQQELQLHSKELEWAHIYHDSIRGIKPIEDLNLNIGRWAGNYSFFYVLNRILYDYRPSSILELGLGESTKFISTFIKNFIPDCNHIVVEQNEEWIISFKNRFELTSQTKILHLPLEIKQVNNFEAICYKKFIEIINNKFQLYIVDGPFGSDRFSRNDILSLVEKFDKNEFIIMFDDSHRKGEQDTIMEIIKILKSKNISYYTGDYSGNKSVTIIASETFKYTTSL